MIFIANHCHFHPSIELVSYRHWWKIWCWLWWRSFKVGIWWWWLLLEIHGAYCRQVYYALMTTLFNFILAFLSLSQSSQVHGLMIALFNFPSFWLSFQLHFLHVSMPWWLQISNFPSLAFISLSSEMITYWCTYSSLWLYFIFTHTFPFLEQTFQITL